jgi:conjugative transfer pilus assembly protein TraH
MKTKIKVLAASVSAVLFIAAWSPSASATSWMTDFYSTAGASINVTPNAVVQTQTTNVISGGGFAVRAPRKNVQLLNVTPPGFKAGCGGIDFWAGSFGFINKEQLVQFLRNIGQNALGLFFQLALKSMAPEVAATIEVMQDWAQRINQFNMNSCDGAAVHQ